MPTFFWNFIGKSGVRFIVGTCSLLLLTGFCVALSGCHAVSAQTAGPHRAKTPTQSNSIPVIHVVVALCDNKYQGIVPVPAKIGNGDVPEENLYWGCDLGVKTYFRHSSNWKLEKTIKHPSKFVMERLVFTNRSHKAIIVADAYRGREIKSATEDFLAFASGSKPETIEIQKQSLTIGGGADFVVYVGHDGLMNFTVANKIGQAGIQPKKVAVLCCKSKEFFGPAERAANANPILWTKSLMAPEAYVVEAAVQSFLRKESGNIATDRAAKAYAKYHKISMRAGRTVFTSRF